MKLILLFLSILFIEAKFDLTLPDDELFIQFKLKYNRNYETPEEEAKRHEIFQSNLKKIRQRNSERKYEWEASYGINNFSDKLSSEIQRKSLKQLLKQDIPQGNPSTGLDFYFNSNYYEPPQLPSGDNLPENLFYCSSLVSKNTDHPKIDFCGEPINQGTCGCCYAASLSNLGQYKYGNLTYNFYDKNEAKIEKINLSPQRMMDRMGSQESRCCGGHQAEALYFTQNFSTVEEYPFVDINGDDETDCTPRGDQNSNVPIVMNIYNYQLFATSEMGSHEKEVLTLKKILHHYGPFASSINSKCGGDALMGYENGIFTFPQSCDPSAIDHAILVMGYGKEDGKEYFLIRNSWGEWGLDDKGYIKVSTDVLCGLGYVKPKENGHYRTISSNVIAFIGSCKLDKNCDQCDEKTLKCSKCKDNFTHDVNGMCSVPAQSSSSQLYLFFILILFLFI